MVATWVVVVVSVSYLGLLFAIAYVGDRAAARGRSVISNGYIYALSIAVYATSWTYYGSVGSAAAGGIAWLPIYLGPMVVVTLWWVLLRKIIRICKRDRITSLADFVSSRYGKSQALGGLVTVIAVLGLVPYIALQLKAISTTFTILRDDVSPAAGTGSVPVLQDTALYAALLLAAFTIVFGTRHLDATERHEGMVAAIAFESLVKLVAFLVVGAWVTFGLFDGFPDIVARAAEDPALAELLTLSPTTSYGTFLWFTVLSMLAFLLLPRQWQVAVVENVDERHVRTAMWLFPLYLLLINLFVLPIALGGLLTFGEGGAVNADTFVLALPMEGQQPLLALLVFVGGLSAATGMVIVETIALSTMVSNSLVMPLLLRSRATLRGRHDLGRVVLLVRRVTIVALLLMGFVYFRIATDALGLVQIGLISFAAVAQFAPAVLGGLYWKGVTHSGAVAGLLAGIGLWGYTLLLPSFSESGWLRSSLPTDGPFGVELLAPYALFGLDGLHPVSHAMLWSMLANIGVLVTVSLFTDRGPVEHVQAAVFVDAMQRTGSREPGLWRGSATVGALSGLLERFVGPRGARDALDAYAARTPADVNPDAAADAELIHHVETLLAGSVGSASARVLVASVVSEEPLGMNEVMEILDEASQVRAYSRALERKSLELEQATAELREANVQLQELDRLKDDFVSTVTHELRTPLTSIRAFSEILVDNPDLDAEERQRFLEPIVDETERLTRLINQVLDLAKLESGAAEWHVGPVDLREVVDASTATTAQLFRAQGVLLDLDLPERLPLVAADSDRVMQVMVNLLGNAVKFADPEQGRVRVGVTVRDDEVQVDVEDNGPGIPDADLEVIFDKFRQGGDTHRDRPSGTGLGLPISREIIGHLGGRLWASRHVGHGATFSFTLPVAAREV